MQKLSISTFKLNEILSKTGAPALLSSLAEMRIGSLEGVKQFLRRKTVL